MWRNVILALAVAIVMCGGCAGRAETAKQSPVRAAPMLPHHQPEVLLPPYLSRDKLSVISFDFTRFDAERAAAWFRRFADEAAAEGKRSADGPVDPEGRAKVRRWIESLRQFWVACSAGGAQRAYICVDLWGWMTGDGPGTIIVPINPGGDPRRVARALDRTLNADDAMAGEARGPAKARSSVMIKGDVVIAFGPRESALRAATQPAIASTQPQKPMLGAVEFARGVGNAKPSGFTWIFPAQPPEDGPDRPRAEAAAPEQLNFLTVSLDFPPSPTEAVFRIEAATPEMAKALAPRLQQTAMSGFANISRPPKDYLERVQKWTAPAIEGRTVTVRIEREVVERWLMPSLIGAYVNGERATGEAVSRYQAIGRQWDYEKRRDVTDWDELKLKK